MATSIDPTIRELRQTINRMEAMIGARGDFTLKPNAATTVVFHSQVAPGSTVTVQPTSQGAAQELASGSMWWTCGMRSITIHHASSANTTRTFNFSVTV